MQGSQLKGYQMVPELNAVQRYKRMERAFLEKALERARDEADEVRSASGWEACAAEEDAHRSPIATPSFGSGLGQG